MNKKERSRVLRALRVVRSTSWASWAVPSGRGRCRSKRAGQILPVFVIAAPFWPSCPRARAAPDEIEREPVLFLRPLRLLFLFLLYFSPDTKGSARERTQISEDKPVHTQHAVRCNGPGLV